MFHSVRLAYLCIQYAIPLRVGFPIQKSPDQSLFASSPKLIAGYHVFRRGIVTGKRIRHDQVHNLYGYMMTRAAGEAFLELQPEKRILLFSRASYIGMHRYGGIWTGDNMSWWSHLKLNIQMMPSLNMGGILS